MTSLDDGDYLTYKDKVDILFNKYHSLYSGGNNTEYFEANFSLQNRDFVIATKQIWSNDVPDNAPEFQYTDVEAISGSTNPIPGVTTPVDYSHIKKYLTMEMAVVDNNLTENTYFLSELRDSIPFTYDSSGSYIGILYRNDGTTIIPFGPSGGNWNIDYTNGTLTFFNYDVVSSYVDAASPPKITFYRYEGNKGLVPGTTNVAINTIEVFNGGDSIGTADTLSSVIIDDRAVGSFDVTDYSRSLNFGGYNEGSWRISIQGGSAGTPSNSKFVIQKRTGSGWDTKHELQ